MRLLFLVLANPTHAVTVQELPVYTPSPEEQENPRLFAENVRQYMVWCVWLFGVYGMYCVLCVVCGVR